MMPNQLQLQGPNTKSHTTTARRNSSIQQRHKATALQVVRLEQTTGPNTQARFHRAEICTATQIDITRSDHKPTENRLTAAERIKEIAFVSRQLFREGYRALIATYETLVAAAHIIAQAGKLTWAVGCLTVAIGRYIYDTGKSLWERLVA
jgi:hypothetical protein